jgi:hypothetical protein
MASTKPVSHTTQKLLLHELNDFVLSRTHRSLHAIPVAMVHVIVHVVHTLTALARPWGVNCAPLRLDSQARDLQKAAPAPAGVPRKPLAVVNRVAGSVNASETAGQMLSRLASRSLALARKRPRTDRNGQSRDRAFRARIWGFFYSHALRPKFSLSLAPKSAASFARREER